MDEKKIEFLKQAVEVYMKLGIKSVTMDEMAKQLGISKKTIYTFVADKNELVEACLELAHQGEMCEVSQICVKHENAIDELLAIADSVTNRLRAIHPSIFFDLQKYHLNAWNKFNDYSNTFIKSCVINNLKKGINQGYFRENINVEILAKMYLSFIEVLFKGDIFPSHEFLYKDVYSEYFRYHIRGIASPKGLDYLQKILKTKNLDI